MNLNLDVLWFSVLFKIKVIVIINDNQIGKNRIKFELSNNTTHKVQCQTILFK